MDYIELVCKIDSNQIQLVREMLTQELAGIGYESFVDTDKGLLAYISNRDFDSKELNSITFYSELSLGNISYKWELIKDQNWNKEWESNFAPVIIGNSCYVRATFHQPKPEIKYEIVIEPKMSFGTGHHETTSLMIEQMLDMPIKGKNILDMGCGTGILAILASKLEASAVVAIDIDEWAYNNALDNLKLNNTLDVRVIQGDKTSIPQNMFDIVLANINRNILLSDMETYYSVVAKGGLLLISGIYKTDLNVVSESAESYGFTFAKSIEKNNWVSALYTN